MQPSCNRSSPSCFQTRTTSSTASNLLLQQQHNHHHQQPQSFYGPVTLQPFTAVLHPSCIYSAQRNTGLLNPALMTPQGSEWQTKNKTQAVNLRNRQIFYSTKPFDQQQINPSVPSSSSPYLLTASNVCHGPYANDQNNSGLTVISQPYFKPPDVQALCLVQDRQFITQQQTHQYNPYYNLSSTLQTVTANTNLQLPTYPPPFTSNPMFPNPQQNSIFHPPKENQRSTIEFSLKYPKNKPNSSSTQFLNQRNDYEETVNCNPSSSDYRQFCAEVQNKANSSTKGQDERMSDDSSTSFDFTIEAEKMVSALCNTSSNDLEKFDTSKSLLNGAGDIGFDNFSITDVGIDPSGTSIAIQTDDNIAKYPEMIRKTSIWGCNQAENVLNSAKCHRTTKLEWLMNLSIATRTAITKSSTCFSIFAGDQILIQDLINSLLRISNGWLILDNYLNKQHSPSLNDKYDRNLIKSFQIWEGATHELLQNVVNTFLHLEEKSEQEEIETSGTPGTFPGDVSIYTTCDLLEPPIKFNLAPGSAVISPSQNFQYIADQKKGTKPKSKWTITESNSSENSNQSTTKKLEIRNRDTCTSLNAEFFHLRNKILEDKTWNSNKTNKSESMDQIFKKTDNQPLLITKTNSRKIFNLNGPIVKPKLMDHRDVGSAPLNMTLLSQIEPNTSASKKEEMTANLSAWFASMRNITTDSKSETRIINISRNQDLSRDKMDLTRQLQLDTNRQILSLQNMQSIQSAPWNAVNLINNSNVQQTHDEYDSSEDVRIYMKPGSYNVPKKRHQKRSNRRGDNSRYGVRHSNKTLSIPSKIDANFPGKINFPLSDSLFDQSRDTEDVTWKAACASAEVLLEALNVNESSNSQVDQHLIQASHHQKINTETPFREKNDEYQMFSNKQIFSDRYDDSILSDTFKNNQNYCDHERQLLLNNDHKLQEKDLMFNPHATFRYQNESKHKIKTQTARDEPRMMKDLTRHKDLLIRYQDQLISQITKQTMNKNQNQNDKPSQKQFPDNYTDNYITSNQDQIIRKQDQILKHRNQDQIINEREMMIKNDTFSDQEESVKFEINQNISKTRNRGFIEFNYQDDRREKLIRNHDPQHQMQDRGKYQKTEIEQSNYEKNELNVQVEKNQDQGKGELIKNKDSLKERISRGQNQQMKDHLIKEQMIRNQNQKQRRSKTKKQRDDKNDPYSSYEASEDDSEPSPKTSRSLKRLTDIKIGKTNIKTDSWLIRTLNNVSKGTNNQNDLASSDSLNSSIHDDEQIDIINHHFPTKASNPKDLFPNFSNINHQLPCENFQGKATYSETVRRSASNTNKRESYKLPKTDGNDLIVNGPFDSFTGKKVNKKEVEKLCLVHQKSRKISGKRFIKDNETDIQSDNKIKGKFFKDEAKLTTTGKSSLGRGRRKDNNLILDGKYKSDRGWSVWYSSRKKQTLSPLNVRKLETIHQTIWKMDEACLFKYPSSIGVESQHKMIDNYGKIVKTPMFLETIGQKLKNRAYLKVEHAVRDFRKIVCNSRLYHKNDSDFSAKIDLMSKKMEELFEEHFSNLDFENVSSAGDTSPVCQRFKLQSQRNRCNPSKKSITTSDKINSTNENLN